MGNGDVTLISCTNTKRDEPAAARNLYDPSGYFCDMRAYAEARDRPWFILSAKHGLLAPDERIAPYDAVGLTETQAERIAEELSEQGFQPVHITAGKRYTGPLIPALEGCGIDVVEVCRGMRIGERRSWLQTRTAELLDGTVQG